MRDAASGRTFSRASVRTHECQPQHDSLARRHVKSMRSRALPGPQRLLKRAANSLCAEVRPYPMKVRHPRPVSWWFNSKAWTSYKHYIILPPIRTPYPLAINTRRSASSASKGSHRRPHRAQPKGDHLGLRSLCFIYHLIGQTSARCQEYRALLSFCLSRSAYAGHVEATSSVHTEKRLTTFGPKALPIATSAASEPRAIDTRMRFGNSARLSRDGRAASPCRYKGRASRFVSIRR
jgi:hypothetical protein